MRKWDKAKNLEEISSQFRLESTQQITNKRRLACHEN
jgi:hypothetical protein